MILKMFLGAFLGIVFSASYKFLYDDEEPHIENRRGFPSDNSLYYTGFLFIAGMVVSYFLNI